MKDPLNPGKQKCRLLSYFILLFNVALVGVLTFFIKNQNEDKLVTENYDESLELIPSSEKVRDANNQIITDRENKLRDLNISPKELKQLETTTTTTTTTTTPDPKPASSSSDAKTKSS